MLLWRMQCWVSLAFLFLLPMVFRLFLPLFSPIQPFHLLCFDTHTNAGFASRMPLREAFSRISFLLIVMQNARGWGMPSLSYDLHSFALFGKSADPSTFFSIACALFAEKGWGVPQNQKSADSSRALFIEVCKFLGGRLSLATRHSSLATALQRSFGDFLLQRFHHFAQRLRAQ